MLPPLQCGTIAKNTLDILEDVGAWNESHSTIDLFKESVPGVGDDLSMDEKLANVVDRLEFALEE